MEHIIMEYIILFILTIFVGMIICAISCVVEIFVLQFIKLIKYIKLRLYEL
jgi:hypothetical protein